MLRDLWLLRGFVLVGVSSETSLPNHPFRHGTHLITSRNFKERKVSFEKTCTFVNWKRGLDRENMMVLTAGKLLPFFIVLHQVLLKSSQVLGASANISWFPDYEKYKPTHYGKHFILGFPSSGNENLLDQISIAALFDTNVTITPALSKNALYTAHIKAGKTVQYNVPNSLRITQIGTGSKGVEINATDDIAVIVLLRDSSGDSDAFVALPANVLGIQYVVSTWTYPYGLPQMVVISCYDKTVVNIKLRMSRSSAFSYEERSYNNGNVLSVTLDKLGTSYVFGDADFSGTVIMADKPIAVISGQLNAAVSSTSDHDNLASFLLPVKNWGTKFILPPVGMVNVGDFFRVFASYRDTIVKNGNSKTVLQPGEYVQLDQGSSKASFVNCSKQCQVTQYTRLQSRSGVYSYAGPSMINLPSIEQFLPSYYVVLLAGEKYRHSITLVIKQYVKDGLLLNGKPLSGLSWKTVGNTKYVWVVVDINDNKYITHSVPGVTFGLLVFGAQYQISYGYPGGFAFQKKEAKPCKRKVDLGFVLDSSGSVSTSNYQRMKTFVKDLTNIFTISPHETRVSVMSFSNDATIHIPFSRHFDDNIELSTAIDAIDYSGGGTATAIALNKAYDDMFQAKNGARKTGVNAVLIILTDGQSSGGVEGPAEKLKNAGVIIFSVGIGQNINTDELYSMASQPKEQRVILLENFQELSSLAKKMSSTTCNVSRFTVLCDKDSMSLTYERRSLPDYMNVDELALQDRSCKARYNTTHIIAKTALNGCGTLFRETEQELIFSNALTTANIPTSGAIISREKEISLKFSCTYGRLRTVGSFNFLPARQKLTITEKNVGNLTFVMEFYKDSSYGQAYTDHDYPVSKSLSDQIYVQYSVDTSNSDIVIRAKTCRATPTNKPYDQHHYVFIDNGCDEDPTIQHYTSGLQQVHRFSIQAFSFVISHRYVYFHCDLVVCKKGTANSICTKSTSCPKRRRRDARSVDDGSKFYQLSTGPLIYRGKRNEVNSKENSPSLGILLGSLTGIVILAAILISIFVFIIVRRRGAFENSSNVQVLSMENFVETKE